MEWLPIESATKNGSYILLSYGGERPVVGRWNDDRYARKPKPYWATDTSRLTGTRFLRKNDQIAWMPLPNPPKQDEVAK